MKKGKEIKKYKTRFHSRKSCFSLSKTMFIMLCAQLQEPSRNKREKKMLLTIEHLSWPLGKYNFAKA